MLKKIAHSKKIIKDALHNYRKVAVACSFGKDSIVLVHLVSQIDQSVPIFTVMTPFKPKETFKYKDKMIKMWRLNIKEYYQKDDINAKKRKLWLKNPDECCEYFKVKPTKKAVENLGAWITGLRCTEGKTRINYQEIEYKKNLVKINPILNWTELDIWRYIAINKIPVHPWYKKGYRSLGCEPCTSLISDNESERAGRWKGTKKCGGECGIHTKELK
jgi:phosphoadenosine phosphosulfate reductase